MKANEIKPGYIYYVNYDPVRDLEFRGKHLAFVLKKNHDAITYVTIPLTSKAKSEITNIPLGVINDLPDSLKEKITYAVIDQIRTVNASRFSPILRENKRIDVKMPEEMITKIINSVANDLFRDFNNIEVSVKSKYNLKKIMKNVILKEMNPNQTRGLK